MANLGPMDQDTQLNFQAKAAVEATKHGITNPRLMIDINLKVANDFGFTEQPYPISATRGL